MTNNYFLTLFFSMFSLITVAQINYESGYFIESNGKKTTCLIKNTDWEVSPTSIQYKIDENSIPLEISLQNCIEFGINNNIKYIAREVAIDQSSDNINYLSYERNPIFKTQKVFLRVLTEGKASLYMYGLMNQKKFFYSTETVEIKQLIYKRFYMRSQRDIAPGTNNTSENFNMHENNYFQSQLFQDVNCNKSNVKSFGKIKYTQSDFLAYFKEYNACASNGTNVDQFAEAVIKSNKNLFNLKLLIGLNQSSLGIESIVLEENFNFEKKTGISYGAEFEYVLPFNKNKWAIFLAPNYNSYSSSYTYTYMKFSGNQKVTEVLNTKASGIEIPIGVRHYFFLSNHSKIFINAAYVASFYNVDNFASDNNKIAMTEYKNSSTTLAIGIGYSYQNFNLEIRSYGKQDLDNYLYKQSLYRKLSLIFSYKIL